MGSMGKDYRAFMGDRGVENSMGIDYDQIEIDAESVDSGGREYRGVGDSPTRGERPPKAQKSVRLQCRTYSPYDEGTDVFAGEAVRNDRGQFVSGHHMGRPMTPEELRTRVRALCPTAVDVLSSIVASNGAKESDRIRAAEVLLDRGYGRPAQSVDVSGSGIPQVVIVGDVED